MKNFTALPTANEEWGFWGTSVQNGYNAELTWDVTSKFLAERFELTAEETRTVLDSRFGRHLADDLSFAKYGPHSAVSIIAHLTNRTADKKWLASIEKSITAETGKKFTRKPTVTKDQLFTQIAAQHLHIETLETRNSDSLDFHDTAVWSIKAALEAAYEAGRNVKKGA